MASLAGIILGILLGNILQPHVSKILINVFPDTDLVPIISIALIFIVIMILANLAGWGLKRLFKKSLLAWLDRLLGGAFAVLKTVILAYVFIIILTFYVPAKSALITDSLLAPWIIKSYQATIGRISPEHYKKWKNKIVGKARDINSAINEKIKK